MRERERFGILEDKLRLTATTKGFEGNGRSKSEKWSARGSIFLSAIENRSDIRIAERR